MRRIVKMLCAFAIVFLFIQLSYETEAATLNVSYIYPEAELYEGDVYWVKARVNGLDSGETVTKYQWQVTYLRYDNVTVVLDLKEEDNWLGAYTDTFGFETSVGNAATSEKDWNDNWGGWLGFQCTVTTSKGRKSTGSVYHIPHPVEAIPISTFIFADLNEPQENELFDYSAVSMGSSVYSVDKIEWYNTYDDTPANLLDSSAKAVAGKNYSCRLYFSMKDSYKISDGKLAVAIHDSQDRFFPENYKKGYIKGYYTANPAPTIDKISSGVKTSIGTEPGKAEVTVEATNASHYGWEIIEYTVDLKGHMMKKTPVLLTDSNYKSYKDKGITFTGISGKTLTIESTKNAKFYVRAVVSGDSKIDIRSNNVHVEFFYDGLVSNGGKRYYYADEKKQYGWQIIDRRYHYFDAEDGHEYSNMWSFIEGDWYYFSENGEMKTGWLDYEGHWYYLNHDGRMLKNTWLFYASTWYYFDKNGYMVTDWCRIGNYWYYFGKDGMMCSGWVQVGGKYYYMNSDGQMQTGWLNWGKNRYYLTGNGDMATGWKLIDGKYYYFASTGEMKTGWVLYQGDYYYLDKTTGVMMTNYWVWEAGEKKWYYVKSDGKMAKNETLVIDGKTYSFSSTGAML